MCCWKNTQPLSPKIDFPSAIGNASAGGDYEQTPHPPQSHWPDRDGEWYSSKRHYMVSAWGEVGRVWNGSKPSSPSLPEGINCMTVSWLGKEGGESGESLIKTLSSLLAQKILHHSVLAWGGGRADKTISPRGIGHGRLSQKRTPQRRIRAKGAKRKRVRNDKMSGNLGVGHCVPNGKRFRNDKSVW